MDRVYIGTIVNTHGVRGELRLRSDFEYKKLVFKPGVKVYINNNEYTIRTYRYHKIFDMITLEGYDNINDVIMLKTKKVYVDRSVLNLENDSYLLEDLIGCTLVIDNNEIGLIKDYITGQNPLLIANIDNKTKYIPNNKDFIKEVDINNKKVYLEAIAKGVI